MVFRLSGTGGRNDLNFIHGTFPGFLSLGLSVNPVNGQLIGHIVMGVEMIGSHIREIPGFPPVLASELKHCILAHHGEFEYGSPKKPAIIEAAALNFADNADAKLEIMKEQLASATPGEWIGFNRLMDSNIKKTVLQ